MRLAVSFTFASMISLGLVSQTRAEGHEERFAFRGAGAAECTRLIEWSEADLSFAPYFSWIYGFWTGINMSFQAWDQQMRNINDPSVDPKLLEARLIVYCYENPDHTLDAAAVEIFDALPLIETSRN